MQLLYRMPVSRRLGSLVILAVALMLALLASLILSERQVLMDERQAAVRQTVELAHGIVHNAHALQLEGKLTQEQAQQQALALLQKLRYSGSEYFWVNDMHPRMVMHAARPQLDGEDLTDNKDPNGNRLFVEFVNIVKREGKGFHNYMWPMPGSDAPVEKTSYVMGFAPWEWVIGSGVYIDTIEATFAQRVQHAVGITAILMVVLMLAGWMIARSILRQLGAEPARLSDITRQMSQGDLTVDLPSRIPPDSVLQGMQTLKDNIGRIVGNVMQGAQNLASASEQINQGNQELSSRTESQASALQETAAAMEELGSTVRHNADNAKQANQMAVTASQVAEQGGEVVAEVVETMKGINEASRKISDIIGVIDGIAFQTNILALNAAVEAARAGEQGRGFAVVAGEVRSLAQRSAEAAKEIKSLITTSVERVDQGSALVDRAGATMADVVTSIRRVSDIVGEISAATSEQSQGIAQVSEAV
ncbi:MAG: methyl-accepting chemotaxis protein, partial [Comamonas sp.]